MATDIKRRQTDLSASFADTLTGSVSAPRTIQALCRTCKYVRHPGYGVTWISASSAVAIAGLSALPSYAAYAQNTLHRWISFATAKLPARNLKRGSLLDQVQAEQLAALADPRIIGISPSAGLLGLGQQRRRTPKAVLYGMTPSIAWLRTRRRRTSVANRIAVGPVYTPW